MRRTPLKRKTPLQAKTPLRAGRNVASIGRGKSPSDDRAARTEKPRSPLPRRSKKGQQQDREREKAKAVVWERARGRCELASLIAQVDPLNRMCWGQVEYHEPKKRSRGGDPANPDEMVLACHGHNRWCEENVALADEIGALKHSWAKS